MPFKSKAQQKFMFAKHPKIAKRFARETPHMASLPAKVKRRKGKKVVKTAKRYPRTV